MPAPRPKREAATASGETTKYMYKTAKNSITYPLTPGSFGSGTQAKHSPTSSKANLSPTYFNAHASGSGTTGGNYASPAKKRKVTKSPQTPKSAGRVPAAPTQSATSEDSDGSDASEDSEASWSTSLCSVSDAERLSHSPAPTRPAAPATSAQKRHRGGPPATTTGSAPSASSHAPLPRPPPSARVFWPPTNNSGVIHRTRTRGMPDPDIEVVQSLERLLCPLTGQVLVDAVRSRCGHVYSRAAILAHIKHKSDCPVCQHRLNKMHLIADPEADTRSRMLEDTFNAKIKAEVVKNIVVDLTGGSSREGSPDVEAQPAPGPIPKHRRPPPTVVLVDDDDSSIIDATDL